MRFKELFKDRKFVIRFILFIVALIMSVTGITLGVLGLAGNKEGYKVITAYPVEDAMLYANDFTFNYYFEGRSGEIKEQTNAVTSVYSNALSRAYKLFDPRNTYDGFENIATLNRSGGEEVKVGAELYAVLKDAYRRTQEDDGYNMFAGAFYDYVYSILILEDPAEFDPLKNEETAERLEKIRKLVQKKESFELSFLDDNEYKVSFLVSDEYEKEARELEIEAGPLDLNLLKDAYMVEIVSDALGREGYNNGYISTKSGLTYALSAQKGLQFCIYGLQGSTPAILETLPSNSRAAYSSFKAFGFGNEKMYYTVQKDGKTVYRNPYISDKGENDRYLSLYSILNIPDGSSQAYPCADAVCRNLKIWCGSADGEDADGSGFENAYVLFEQPGVVFR